MHDDFLKYELEAEARSSNRDKLVLIIMAIVIVLAGSLGVVMWVHGQSSNQSAAEKPLDADNTHSTDTIQVLNSPSYMTEPKPKQSVNAEEQNSDTNALSDGSNKRFQEKESPTIDNTYNPEMPSLDKIGFVADGKKVLTNYGSIDGLVTFSQSTTDSEKTGRIKQALDLSRKYFSQVSDLRGHLVWANVSSGPYMDATKLAEDGTAKIGVGLTFMNYWVDDHSRTSDLSSGLNSVAEGTTVLLDFSNKLDNL